MVRSPRCILPAKMRPTRQIRQIQRGGPKGKPSSPESHDPAKKAPYPVTFETFRHFFETRSPEVVASIIICLIHQINYLLDQ